MDGFDPGGFLLRVLFAVALVLPTFNPTRHSCYDWRLDGFPSVQPLEAIAGIVGWVVSQASVDRRDA